MGVSCIADGPDTWFARAVLDDGGTIEVVIPAETYRESLPVWQHSDYDALLGAAAAVHTTGMTETDEQAYMVGSEIPVGLAGQLLAVWDGQLARGYRGTAYVMTYAEQSGVPVRVIWPEEARRD